VVAYLYDRHACLAGLAGDVASRLWVAFYVTSLNGTRCSLKYRFARRHHEHVGVLNNTTVDAG
jgi:hypothetical protein